MLGVIYSSASDFSAFSYPRSPSTEEPCLCLEDHNTSIEERYCPKEHGWKGSDEAWDRLLARELELVAGQDSHDVYSDNMPDLSSMGSMLTSRAGSPLSTPPLSMDDPDSDSSTCSDCDSDSDADSDCGSASHSHSHSASERITIVIKKPRPTITIDTNIATTPAITTDAPPAGNNTTTTTRTKPSKKRKRGSRGRTSAPRKRPLVRADSSTSVLSLSSLPSLSSSMSSPITSSPSSSLASPFAADGANPWKCPHCPWVQHTQRLPDFLRHQRSHFVSQSDWPCPNPRCGKGFARKDSLKRHLDNRATGCRRPAGYTVC